MDAVSKSVSVKYTDGRDSGWSNYGKLSIVFASQRVAMTNLVLGFLNSTTALPASAGGNASKVSRNSLRFTRSLRQYGGLQTLLEKR
jgi:hypothetical protein